MENENTSGFYKNDKGCLCYGQNYVLSGSYNLYKEQKNEYEYPVCGWYWFDSEDEARNFLNLPKPIFNPRSLFPSPNNS